ncbi:hypothetical protein LTR04_004027, partial [Oleoguttula sp. CCFEE 6159]
PDVLVVQGSDAGGHGLERGAGVVSLLPEVGDTLKKHCAAQKLPALMAAGGIVEGRGVAASLVLGADGVVMGTRYLAAEEADISKGYSDEVLRASDGGANTVRSKVYDSLRGTTDWPEGYNGRGIINQSYHDSISGMDLEKNKGLYAKALETGDAGWGVQGRLTTYAGTGVGLVTEMQSAKQITEEVREEAKRILGSFGDEANVDQETNLVERTEYCETASQGVDEVRPASNVSNVGEAGDESRKPLVSERVDVFLAQAHDPVVSLPSQTFTVLAPQCQVRRDTSNQQEQDQVCHDNSVAELVARLVHRPVDVAAHHTVKVAKPNDEAQSDTTLVGALGVVTGPGDRVGNARIDTQRSKERARVFDGGHLGAELHGETCDAQEADKNVAQATLPRLVCDPTDENGEYGGSSVRWDREEVGPGARVTQLTNDGWEEEGEGVERHDGASVDDGESVGLPVRDTGPEISHLEVFVLCAGLLVDLQAPNDTCAIGFGEKLGLIREIVNHP